MKNAACFSKLGKCVAGCWPVAGCSQFGHHDTKQYGNSLNCYLRTVPRRDVTWRDMAWPIDVQIVTIELIVTFYVILGQLLQLCDAGCGVGVQEMYRPLSILFLQHLSGLVTAVICEQSSSWIRVFLETLTVAQLLKKFRTFYGTRRFSTVVTRARHWPRWIQSTYNCYRSLCHFPSNRVLYNRCS
jgi:hypothetical protein